VRLNLYYIHYRDTHVASGLLINSEHICTIVASSLHPLFSDNRLPNTNAGNILANYGKEFTRDIKSCIMGRRMWLPLSSKLHRLIPPAIREATAYLLSLFPDLPLTVDAYITHYDAGLACLLPTVTPLPGVCRLIQHFHAHGVPMAIATGCRRKNYDLKTQHLADLFACFGDRVVCGDDLRDGMRGKPTPDIFLMAAREKLSLDVGGVQGACTEAEREVRGRGLVFEDGIPGVQGAKRAGMSGVLSLLPQRTQSRQFSQLFGYPMGTSPPPSIRAPRSLISLSSLWTNSCPKSGGCRPTLVTPCKRLVAPTRALYTMYLELKGTCILMHKTSKPP
jgi:pseudouridine 5'-phosphatase